MHAASFCMNVCSCDISRTKRENHPGAVHHLYVSIAVTILQRLQHARCLFVLTERTQCPFKRHQQASNCHFDKTISCHHVCLLTFVASVSRHCWKALIHQLNLRQILHKSSTFSENKEDNTTVHVNYSEVFRLSPHTRNKNLRAQISTKNSHLKRTFTYFL